MPLQETVPLGLNEVEAAAWAGYRRMRALVDLQIARDIARETGLSDADCEVLLHLSSRRWRLYLLAQRMVWSMSRLSHQVRRMQERGLVTREESGVDGYGGLIFATAEGRRAAEAAAPVYFASVRSHFIDLLADEQVVMFGEATQRIVDQLTGGSTPTTDDTDEGAA